MALWLLEDVVLYPLRLNFAEHMVSKVCITAGNTEERKITGARIRPFVGGKPKMALWVDKYRPTQLDRLDYHPDISKKLKNLVKSHGMPRAPHANGRAKSGAERRRLEPNPLIAALAASRLLAATFRTCSSMAPPVLGRRQE